MATVQVFTAARTQEIEDQAIIDASLVGDNLVLQRHNGATIDVGSVRGPTGSTGPAGSPVPAGSIHMWMFPTLPTGYIWIEGQSILNCNTTYPDLWAAAPSDWKAGSTLNMPNMKGRMPIYQDTAQTEFDTMLETGGSKTTTLVAGNIPPHVHDMSHDHPNVSATTSPDTHNHGVLRPSGNGGEPQYVNSNALDTAVFGVGNVGTNSAPFLTTSDTHDHTVSIDIPPMTANTGNGSSGGLAASAFSNLPPYIVVKFIMKT